ncbi:Bacterial Ig-like domain protein [Caprobacter fermentans]|uniref:Bacterial Ig-like domain protein n=1 Tax=Caproicibacter fermentans TaxID=2576756 RepID=A0A6N8I089_9FIRM|nr:major tail protein [Caproicibacter fermentans]MVB11180.1 Bacterial Ig-like domain protein [Caproicibacter fermentans]
MEKKYGEFVGVDEVHAAIVKEDSEAAYRAETPEYLAPAAEVSSEVSTNNKTTYYDNVPGFNYNTEGVTTITLTLSGVPAKMAAKYLGKHYDESTGRVLDTGLLNPPDTALSFRFNKGADDYRYYQYLKGNFTGGTEDAESKSDDVSEHTYEMTYTAIVTTHKWPIDNKKKGIKRIFGDTDDAAFTADDSWFEQVQTPDTAPKPAELQMTDSIPADNATGVAADSDITLTMNNPISSITATLLDANLASVNITASLDPTKKIITIHPAAVLTAATAYSLVAGEIKDVYGHSIKNTVITFTTA